MRPELDRIDPYFHAFLDAVPEDEPSDALRANREEIAVATASIEESLGDHRYAPGKWSVREILQHIADCERVFQYRALRFARGDSVELSGFDHDAWAPTAVEPGRTVAQIADELDAIRASSEAFFCGVTPAQAARGGVSNGLAMTVTGFAYLMAGHSRHHLSVIQSKYL